LNSNDILVKNSFNHLLKFLKSLEYLRLEFQQVNPCEFAKVVNKANIVCFISHRIQDRAPNVREDKLKWGR
jgi:hypothetical protein